MQRKYLIVAGVLGAGILWFLFRPELLFVNAQVNETLQGTAQRTLAMGAFHDGAHPTKGTATVYEMPNGTRVLRLTDFMTSNGPDVRVLLVAAEDATDNEMVKKAGYVEVAKLKGNLGDQNYELPMDIDLAKYRAVTIWCNRFSVNFGTAPLGKSAS